MHSGLDSKVRRYSIPGGRRIDFDKVPANNGHALIREIDNNVRSIMLYIAVEKVEALSPKPDDFKRLVTYQSTKHPHSNFCSLTRVTKCFGIDFALLCCSEFPELSMHWRRYALWCARRVRLSYGYPYELNEGALATIERFLDGKTSDAAFIDTQSALAPYLSLENGSPGRTIASTTIEDAWLAAKDTALSAALCVARFSGKKAESLINYHGDPLEFDCDRAAAYNKTAIRACADERKAQTDHLLELFRSLKTT